MFSDRSDAGRLLGDSLGFLKGAKSDVVVLAVPRGGVLVGREVARSLGVPLDLIITRKIGAPGNPELAIGAVAQDGEVTADAELMASLRVPEEYLKKESARQSAEIRKRTKDYRGDRPFPSLLGKTVVVVDDGAATGSTIRAAVRSVRRLGAGTVVVAVPVGPPETIRALSEVADRVVCLEMSPHFGAVSQFYREFAQTSDEEVREVMRAQAEQ